MATVPDVDALVRARPFDLRRVRLTGGPVLELQELNRSYLRELDVDRLVHSFRVTAGLPSSAEPLGGWESPDCELRGHFVGHVLTALALMHSSTGDDVLRTRADELVAALAECQDALGTGYLSAFPEEFFDRVETGVKVWAPYYTLHKILAGMVDAHRRLGIARALDVAAGLAGWVGSRTGRLDDEAMQRMLGVEFGGMAEAFWDLYGVTGDPRHAGLARRFEHGAVLDPLADARDEIEGLHANTQIPKVIGAARAYETEGDPRDHRIAEFFWETVVGGRAYCCGGTSNYEYWRTPPGRLAGELSATTHENCCTHNMLKLTRHLFAWRPEARLMDYYERALFSGIMPTQHPRMGGAFMYYVPMKSGLFKLFCEPEHSHVCCSGTGIESFAKLADTVYFHDEGGLYVNLFVASELDWREGRMRVRQETAFPDEEKTTLVIDAEEPVETAVRVRVPSWADGARASVNGRPCGERLAPGTYLELTRTWRRGDRVELSLPMRLKLEPMPDDPGLAAVTYGPVVLAGDLGADGMTPAMVEGLGKEAERMNIEGAAAACPRLRLDGRDVAEVLERTGGAALEFRTVGVGDPRDVTLVPFHRLFGQRYAIYWDVGRGDAEQEEVPLAPEGAVDHVTVGDEASERRHNFQAYKYERGDSDGRAWVRSNWWFRYDMAVLSDRPVTIRYAVVREGEARPVSVHVDGEPVDVPAREVALGGGLFEMTFTVPEELTRGKRLVAVMFKVAEETRDVDVGATTVEKRAERRTPRVCAVSVLPA